METQLKICIEDLQEKGSGYRCVDRISESINCYQGKFYEIAHMSKLTKEWDIDCFSKFW